MQLGWIDFSKEERNKVLNVIHLLDEPGAVDELGLGIIRDAFSDIFFPGTSTVQTRAKYFLIVPYILQEAGSGFYGSEINTILRRIDEEERKCRDILIKTSSDGVIGSLVPNSWVLRTPSNIYWNGIKRLGIFNSDLSVKEYIGQTLFERSIKQAKKYGNRDKEAEENEKDDLDAGDIASMHFWNLGDTYHSDWRNGLTIDLLPNEAIYLRGQIITHQRDSLLAYILKNNIDLSKYDSFGSFSADNMDKVNPEMAKLMKLADSFNDLVGLITSRFNIIVSQGKNREATERWGELSYDLQRRAGVDLKALYTKLKIRNINLQVFLLRVQEAFFNNDIDLVDELIVRQEVHRKGSSRAKTKHIGEYPEQEWIGFYILDYRFSPSKRILRDIMNSEVMGNV